jgi:hypothetical protein
MQEPEVSLRIAMKYIQDGMTSKDVVVSIDGAHIKTKETVHFDIESFMYENGYKKYDGNISRWQGEYENTNFTPRIIISSKSGIGDMNIILNDGRTLFVESKKIKSGSGGEYPAMREAIGQLMTSCPDRADIIPVVAVPYTTKSAERVQEWSSNTRIHTAGIRFMLVHENGNVDFI